MDDGTFPISPDDLFAQLGSASAPTVVDVRRDVPDPACGRMVVSAFACVPETVKRWSNVPLSQPVVVYCREGHTVCSPSRFADDHEQLKHGMTIYDALYQWCRIQQEIARMTGPIHSNGVVH